MQKVPSLRPKLSESIFAAYPTARTSFRETEIQESEFPTDCPYGDNDLLDPDFFLFHVDSEISAWELKGCLADG